MDPNQFPYDLNLLVISYTVLILFLNLQIQMDKNYSGNLFYNKTTLEELAKKMT
jgi:hypothetical protein